MTAKTMAEVLAGHQLKLGIRDMQLHCICGWNGGHDLGRTGQFLKHQEAALSAAGFGPVQAARAEDAPIVRYVALTSGETELDEVVAFNAYVHLEAMDDNHWWLLVTSGGKSVHVNLYTKRAKISGHAETDDAEPARAVAERGDG